MTTWFAARRRSEAPAPTDLGSYGQTRGRGLRVTELLRDRMRPRWLRVVAPPGDDDDTEKDSPLC